MSTLELAKTIRNQLDWKGVSIPWSWGLHAMKALPEAKIDSKGYAIRTGDDFRMGGLQFKVQGFKFNGHVRIILDFNDTYIVRFGTLRKGFTLKHEVEGVYCDMLTSLIDNYVETNDGSYK